ncbi:MAG TPA: AMP-binding protein, partial [Burkholderiaceae bacterium]|nr:AMP-binding protein [Burkholderiaceae bacterium]
MNDTPIWTPSAAFAERSAMAGYLRWLEAQRGQRFDSYDALWRWSVSDLEAFWRSIWGHFGLHSPTPFTRALAERRMPGARWFEGATLNYATQVFRHAARGTPAIRFAGEAQALAELSWPELRRRVASLAAALRALGVQRGDRVAAYLPNVPETVVAFLACASVGALWSVCAPDMGAVAVLDRLRQITPRVLLATTGYRWGGRVHDRRDVVRELLAGLPTLQQWIEVPGPAPGLDTTALPRHDWATLIADDVPLAIDDVPFEHPLWVVYSSGTTGAPKPIVH